MGKLSAILLAFVLLISNSENHEDQRAIMQKCIDMESFTKMLHERPLVILDNGKISSKISLNKFKQPVLFLSKMQIEKKKLKAFLVVKKFVVKKDSSFVSLRYDFEGMGAEISLKRKNKEWNIVKQKVFEN